MIVVVESSDLVLVMNVIVMVVSRIEGWSSGERKLLFGSVKVVLIDLGMVMWVMLSLKVKVVKVVVIIFSSVLGISVSDVGCSFF